MRYAIVDPGKQGAMVLFDGLEPIDAWRFTPCSDGVDLHDFEDILFCWSGTSELKGYLEKITPHPHQGVQATATQFYVLGQTVAVLSQYIDDIVEVYPQTWSAFTKRMSAIHHKSNKDLSRGLAKSFFPDFYQKWSKLGSLHDGIADCLAISLYINRDHYLDHLVGD